MKPTFFILLLLGAIYFNGNAQTMSDDSKEKSTNITHLQTVGNRVGWIANGTLYVKDFNKKDLVVIERGVNDFQLDDGPKRRIAILKGKTLFIKQDDVLKWEELDHDVDKFKITNNTIASLVKGRLKYKVGPHTGQIWTYVTQYGLINTFDLSQHHISFIDKGKLKSYDFNSRIWYTLN